MDWIESIPTTHIKKIKDKGVKKGKNKQTNKYRYHDKTINYAALSPSLLTIYLTS